MQAWRDDLNERNVRPFWLDADYEPQNGYYSVRFSRVQSPPSELSLILGDAAHNLRSALDHLAWGIVPIGFRDDPSNSRRVRDIGFPICFHEPPQPKGWRGLVGTKLHGVSRTQAAIIKRHQPFNVPLDERAWHPLALVQEIDNTDKHQVVAVALLRLHGKLEVNEAFVTTEMGFELRRIEYLDGGGGMIAEDGAEVARIHGIPIAGRPKPNVGVISHTATLIVLKNGLPVADALKLMPEAVERVITDIEATL